MGRPRCHRHKVQSIIGGCTRQGPHTHSISQREEQERCLKTNYIICEDFKTFLCAKSREKPDPAEIWEEVRCPVLEDSQIARLIFGGYLSEPWANLAQRESLTSSLWLTHCPCACTSGVCGCGMENGSLLRPEGDVVGANSCNFMQDHASQMQNHPSVLNICELHCEVHCSGYNKLNRLNSIPKKVRNRRAWA